MSFAAKNKILACILVVAFVLPLVYSFFYQIRPVVDARAYDTIAVNILAGCGFKEVCTESYKFDTAITRAGPGYEFFLAGIYGLFGHHYEIVWVLQALLHALSAGLLYAIARRLLPGDEGLFVGLLAAAWFTLSPDLIEISAMLLTETLYLFLVIATWWLFVFLQSARHQKITALVLGLVTGLTILTRPPVALFGIIFCGYFLIKKQYLVLALFIAGLAAALFPWMYRNLLIYDQVVFTTMIGQYNLWIGNRLESTGGQIAGGINQLIDYTAVHGFYTLPQKAKQEFLFFLTHYPLIFIKLCFLRFIRYFSLIRPMGFWFYQHGVKQAVFVACSGVWIALTFIGGYTGLAASVSKRREGWLVVVLLALSCPLLLLPTVVESRYRFQIYPFLVIGFAYSVYWLKVQPSIMKKTLIWIVLILGLISCIDSVLAFEQVIAHLKIF